MVSNRTNRSLDKVSHSFHGNETLSTTQLTLWFDGDELIRAEGPDAPTWGEPQSEESDSEAVASED